MQFRSFSFLPYNYVANTWLIVVIRIMSQHTHFIRLVRHLYCAVQILHCIFMYI